MRTQATRPKDARQLATIRLAAARAALAAKKLADPLPQHVLEAETYHHRLTGKD